jgi:hypothetical protein
MARTYERVIIIHSLDHARAALAAAAALDVPVIIASAPGAAAYLGPQWLSEVAALAAAEHPDARVSVLLDCGDAPGHVLAALRQGIKRIRFTGRAAVAGKLAALAKRQGAELIRGRRKALDLLDSPDPAAACHRWLAGRSAA